MVIDPGKFGRECAEAWYRHPSAVFDRPRDQLAAIIAGKLREAMRPRPLDEWHDDIGDVLWWRFPVNEPPYVGSPLCGDWLDHYHTHWTPIAVPEQPDADADKEVERGD